MAENKKDNLMEKIVSLCKRRGFVYPSAEIYGGTGSIWDFGPMGTELKRNIKNEWWRNMVQERDDIVGIDSSIITNPKVWQASGHTGSGFSDPLIECKECHERFRADHFPIDTPGNDDKANELWRDKWSGLYINFHDSKDYSSKVKYAHEKVSKDGIVLCPKCLADKGFTEPRTFNILMKTFLGAVEGEKSEAYLRGETAQGIFINFKSVLESSRKKLPFGIAQIGKSFRNEITPGNFIYRTREFEQMEMEYFVKPDNSEENYKKWCEARFAWYENLGIKKENLRLRPHEQDELAHYAMAATDVEYKFPFGWSELEGIANRQDYDLQTHEKHSGKDMKYFDEETKTKFWPYVIEPAAGVDRATLAFLVDAYDLIKEGQSGEESDEVVLRLHPRLAPIKAAIFPLVKKDKLPEVARDIYNDLSKHFMVQYDESGSVGRRYRRQDEIGTPWCITVDFDSLKDSSVTIRERDSMEQERIKISEVKDYLEKGLS